LARLRRKKIVLKGAFALSILLALGGAAPASAQATIQSVSLEPLNLSKSTTWNGLALWDPEQGKATLCGVDDLTPRTNSADPWISDPLKCSSWEPSRESTPSSGVYEVVWGKENRAVLVVSNSASDTGGVLVIVPDYTWQAYNTAGSWFYINEDFVKGKFSLLRPQIKPRGIFPDPVGFLRASQELPVKVVQQSLLDDNNFSYDLRRYSQIVLYGHDEYWTTTLRQKLSDAVGSGVGLVNLSGNTGYRIVNRKGNSLGFPSTATTKPQTLWSNFPKLGVSNSDLLGVDFANHPFGWTKREPSALDSQLSHAKEYGAPRSLDVPNAIKQFRGFRVTDASSFLYKGLKVKSGLWIGVNSRALDNELDGIPLDKRGKVSPLFPLPSEKAFSFAAESWTEPFDVTVQRKKETVRRVGFLASGAWKAGKVFSAGSITWTRAIARGDRAIQAITLNALKWARKAN
jgi:hypothetical protein